MHEINQNAAAGDFSFSVNLHVTGRAIRRGQDYIKHGAKRNINVTKLMHPINESSAAEDVVTEEYLLLQKNLFFCSR
jgi:hypothetical protein